MSSRHVLTVRAIDFGGGCRQPAGLRRLTLRYIHRRPPVVARHDRPARRGRHGRPRQSTSSAAPNPSTATGSPSSSIGPHRRHLNTPACQALGSAIFARISEGPTAVNHGVNSSFDEITTVPASPPPGVRWCTACYPLRRKPPVLRRHAPCCSRSARNYPARLVEHATAGPTGRRRSCRSAYVDPALRSG